MLECWRMIKRVHWLELIEKTWRERSIVWLAGVRRAGEGGVRGFV